MLCSQCFSASGCGKKPVTSSGDVLCCVYCGFVFSATGSGVGGGERLRPPVTYYVVFTVMF